MAVPCWLSLPAVRRRAVGRGVRAIGHCARRHGGYDLCRGRQPHDQMGDSRVFGWPAGLLHAVPRRIGAKTSGDERADMSDAAIA